MEQNFMICVRHKWVDVNWSLESGPRTMRVCAKCGTVSLRMEDLEKLPKPKDDDDD